VDRAGQSHLSELFTRRQLALMVGALWLGLAFRQRWQRMRRRQPVL